MKLETERLEIIPLTGQQLKLLTEDIIQFEQELNCQYCGEEMEGFILRLFKKQIKVVEDNSKEYFWHSFWLFKLKNQEKFIGSAAFKNSPDSNGRVEIGYGINKNFQGLGYTTEAIKAMCNWALKQPTVTKVVAETLKSNTKSQSVLKKCNMKLFHETEEYYWWQLTTEDSSR